MMWRARSRFGWQRDGGPRRRVRRFISFRATVGLARLKGKMLVGTARVIRWTSWTHCTERLTVIVARDSDTRAVDVGLLASRASQRAVTIGPSVQMVSVMFVSNGATY